MATGSVFRIACLAAVGLCVMVLALAHGMMRGDFREEGGILLELPWGRATLADVYVGLVLFSGWVFSRERSMTVAVLWTAMILTMGNLATCAYVIWALLTSRSTASVFWMGVRHEA